MSSPDHYSVLGVLPTADDVVIRAAYRALAQRYHPDKWRGDPKEATEKMAEINAAYAVLSDPAKRQEYDQDQSESAQSEPYVGANGTDEEPPHDPLVEKWNIATSIYPDLVTLNRHLSTYSWRVAFAFRARLLQERDFELRSVIALGIEGEYLERYFGKNTAVQNYARKLLHSGHKRIALELNKIVSVMGSHADPDRIICFVESKYQPFVDVDREAREKEEWEYYKKYRV